MASKNEKGDLETQVVAPRSAPKPWVQFIKDLGTYKASIVIVLTPILFSPLLFMGRPEAKCAYCVVIMALYWMFEVMPLAATALMPTFLFPMLGLVGSKEICMQYMPDTNFLFVGGLIIAVAVEKCNLHQRIALRVLTIVGSKPQWIMLGFMLVTGFLSMWISNTATTAMMVPIAISVINQLLKFELAKRRVPNESAMNDGAEELSLSLVRHEIDEKDGKQGQEVAKEEEEEAVDFALLTPQEQSMAKGLLISIAFAANIGGTGTITGTPPNLVMVGILQTLYPGVDTGISYASWMVFAIPLMLVSLIMCWGILVIYFLGIRVCKRGQTHDNSVTEMMKAKYRNLPKMSFAEWAVLILFLILLCMWIFRDPKQFPGFGEIFGKDKKGKPYFKDATSAMLIATLLFALPSELPDFFCFNSRDRTDNPKKRGSLMDWPSMQAKFPWSVVLLLGGGFALAHGVKTSGLSSMVGDVLSALEGAETIAIQLICVLITMAITNICSNTVTATIFVPIVNSLAKKVFIHPLALVLPTTLACSYAFALPVATPPNAIVFASGMLHVGDMMKAGMIITVFSAIFIVVYMQSYALLVISLNEFPDWANATMEGTASLL